MKKIIKSIILGTILSSSLFSAEKCEGFAKYHAIKKYTAEMGTVQGSDGIQYEAKLVDNITEGTETYLVEIYDNNEDFDAWSVNYLVKLQKENSKCKKVELKKIGVVSYSGE